MASINDLEFCHCEINHNLNEMLRAVLGAREIRIFECGHVRRSRLLVAERYAKALEVWLSGTTPTEDFHEECQIVSNLLDKHAHRKIELVRQLINRLRNNKHNVYALGEEDFGTVESRIQHLEICNFNWEQNLLIVLDEIGTGLRAYGWHGIGGYCACGDIDSNNNYPAMMHHVLNGLEAAAVPGRLDALRKRLDRALATPAE